MGGSMSAENTWRQRVEKARDTGLLAGEFFVVLTEPAGSKDKVRDSLKEHLAYQRQLEEQGALVAAGPLSDETGTDWTGKGLIILRADTLEQARKLAEGDPMHSSGARTFTLLPWLMNEGSFTLRVSLSKQSVGFE